MMHACFARVYAPSALSSRSCPTVEASFSAVVIGTSKSSPKRKSSISRSTSIGPSARTIRSATGLFTDATTTGAPPPCAGRSMIAFTTPGTSWFATAKEDSS
jgi:hypothetical protein